MSKKVKYLPGIGLVRTAEESKILPDCGEKQSCSVCEKAKAYDGFMDKECIALCNKLNSLSDIETTESCCGHCKQPYMIFFNCYNFIRLGKLFRCINRNYSDGKWRIECCCSDVSPIYGFLLASKEPFNSNEEMMKSVNSLIENIDYWENPIFDNYFNNNGK